MKENLILKSGTSNYGVCGKKALFKDSNGDNLYIGDVVVLFDRTNECGRRVIVENYGEIFVMGIQCDCPNYEKESWKIYKEKSYMSMKNGDKINEIAYETKKVKEMTISEIEKELGYPIKIIK